MIDSDPLRGIFNNRELDVHKLDFLKLSYKQSIDKMTQDLLSLVQQTDIGREVLRGSDMQNHQYIADIAVHKISKNLEKLEQYNN